MKLVREVKLPRGSLSVRTLVGFIVRDNMRNPVEYCHREN
jgi:hypothetical protein